MKQLYPSLENLKTTLKNVLLDLLKYVVKKNVFKFDHLAFTRLCCVVMGRRLAPALATIYTGELEEDYLHTNQKTSTVGEIY